MPFEPDQPKSSFVPDEEPSLARKALDYMPGVGIGETALAVGSGILGTAAGGFAAGGRMFAPTGEGLRARLQASNELGDKVANAVQYEPRTVIGKGMTRGISLPFDLLSKAGEKAGNVVTEGSQKIGLAKNPVDAAFLGAITDAGINLAPGMVGKVIPKESPAAVAARAKEQALNAPFDQNLAIARENNLKVTPTQAGAGASMRAAEGIAGSPRLEKAASKANAPTFNEMIRRDIGLPEDQPLTRDALNAASKEAGKAYDAVKKSGPIDADAKYQADLYRITNSVDLAAKDFSHRSENPFKKIMDGLNIKSMDAASAVEEVKLLREDAAKAYRDGDKRMGSAYKQASRALDDLLDRNLSRMAASGSPEMAGAVAKYRDARVRIAKIYAAEDALGADGNINANSYVSILKKNPELLTGEALKLAKFAQQFPGASRPVERLGPTGPTVFDAAPLVFGDIPATLRGLLFSARPMARSAMLTSPVQDALTAPRTYGPPKIRRLQDLLNEAGLAAATAGASNKERGQ